MNIWTVPVLTRKIQHTWHHFFQTKEIDHHKDNEISKYFYKRNNHSKVSSNINTKEKVEKSPKDATSIIQINNIEFITQERLT